MSFYAATGYGSNLPVEGTGAERARQLALQAFYVQRDSAAVRVNWQSQTEGPRDPVELAMLAIVEAGAGSDAALPYIQDIRSYDAAEADIALATLLARQGKLDDAATTLESGLRWMTIDPWPLQAMKERALALAEQLGRQNPMLARRMITALKVPFAAGALPDDRLQTAAMLTRVAGLAATCREPLHALEPYSPWTGDMLLLRRDCYLATNDPLFPTAQQELETYAGLEPQPFMILRPFTAR
jgi:hypothetical protein